jgi:NADPH:quinone reductase-like Zn-dependent oxidoreductase
MKAMVCRRWGGPEVLAVEEFASPALPSGSVRVAVRAAGIAFQDTLLIRGKYQTKPAFPVCPGNEICGVVIEIGHAVEQSREVPKLCREFCELSRNPECCLFLRFGGCYAPVGSRA